MPPVSTATSATNLSWSEKSFEAAGGRAPDCDCGGFIKTATVSFGQAMPEAQMRRAQALAEILRSVSGGRFFARGLAGGGLPFWLAKRAGAHLVIVNREPTEFDDVADLVVRHDIGAVLEPFIAQ